MTAHHELDEQLTDFLRDGPTELPYRSFDAVRDRTDQIGQRVVINPWWLRETNKSVAISLGAAAVVVAAIVGVQLIGPPGGGTGGPGDGPTATPGPTATSAGSPSQLPSPSASHTAVTDFQIFPGPPQPLDAGVYRVGPRCQDARGFCLDYPVSISFTVPAGWLSCANNAGFLCPDLPQHRSEPDGVGGVNILIVTNVVADPCDETKLRNPSVGPTVDDLVAAISSLPWAAVTRPTDVTVDGFSGLDFDVTAPTRPPCVGTNDFATWATTDQSEGSAAGVSPGERTRLRILDVGGTRVVIAGSYLPGTTSLRHVAEINAIIDSVRIEPPGG